MGEKNQPDIEPDRRRELIQENTGRTKREDEDPPTVFVYHEWPDEVEAGTIPNVRAIVGDGRDIHPMEAKVCRYCASDMDVSDGRVMVCTTCGAQHPIP